MIAGDDGAERQLRPTDVGPGLHQSAVAEGDEHIRSCTRAASDSRSSRCFSVRASTAATCVRGSSLGRPGRFGTWRNRARALERACHAGAQMLGGPSTSRKMPVQKLAAQVMRKTVSPAISDGRAIRCQRLARQRVPPRRRWPALPDRLRECHRRSHHHPGRPCGPNCHHGGRFRDCRGWSPVSTTKMGRAFRGDGGPFLGLLYAVTVKCEQMCIIRGSAKREPSAIARR